MAESQLVSIDPEETAEITSFKLGIGSQSFECQEHGFHERSIRSVTLITNEYESVVFLLPIPIWNIFKEAVNDLDSTGT